MALGVGARPPAARRERNEIRIRNFRSLADVTVDLEPLTVLIGSSGTGKSNFVQGIRYLRDSLNARSVNANASGGPQRVLHAARQNEPLAYGLRFSIPGLGEVFEYTLVIKLASGEVSEESLSLGGRMLFHQVAKKWIHAPHVVPTPGPNGIMLGSIPGLQESHFAYIALRSGIGCYEFTDAVLTLQGNPGPTGDQGLADRGEN